MPKFSNPRSEKVKMGVTNSPPVTTPDIASVVEDETLVSTGNVLANDTDPNGLPLFVTAVDGIAVTGTTTVIGTYGTLVIQPDGEYAYTLADTQANVRALSNGAVVPDAFTYTVSDGQTYTQTTTETVQNLIPQSEAFNDPTWVQFSSNAYPVITPNVDPGPNGGASTADEVTLTSAASGIYYQTNVAGTYTFSVWVRLIGGDGDFALNYYSGSTNTDLTQAVLASGTWQQVSLTFTGDGNTYSNVALMHDVSQSATGTFEFWGAQLNPGSAVEPYVPTSGSPVTTTVNVTTPIVVGSTLTVDVTGNTPVATPDTASVAEGGALVATGNVLANDTDGAGKTLSVVTVNGIALNGTTTIVGTYGTLVIQSDGQYTYTLAGGQANVLALTAGQMVQDAFTYTVSDGNTYTQTATQTVQNLIPQSEAFNDPTWVRFSSGAYPMVTPNVDSGPNGGPSTADAVTLTSASSGLFFQTGVAGTYTFSVWVKLTGGDGDFALNYYSGSTNLSDTESLLANGTWQQVSLTFTGDGNVNSNVALMHSATQSASGTFELWGAQLNPGSTIEPYVPTSGSPVTTVVTTTTPLVVGSTLTVDITDVVCFAAGTCIATPQGMVSVETLCVGDTVLTHGGATRPIRWIGQRSLDLMRHSVPERVQPIRILADAFADGVPRRDLYLSPDHGVLVDGLLIPARLLTNGASIVREVDCRAVTYFHIELDAHDVLLAEGLPAESYLDTGNRGFFGDGITPLQLYPDAVGQQRREAESCAPFAADATRVRPIWRWLAVRSAALGYRLPNAPESTEDPDLRVMLGERCLPPITANNGRYVFALPATDRAIWLTSRTTVPSDVHPWIEDRRRLGVMVSRLTLLTSDGVETIPLDHPSFGDGWWAAEWHGTTALRRWTDGQARLPIQTGIPTLLEVELGGTALAYPIMSLREHPGDRYAT
jgi:VCBS repeat-containing protein